MYPDATDESQAEVEQFREGVQMDPIQAMAGFEKDFNNYLWQKRTFILGTCLMFKFSPVLMLN